MDLKEPGNPLYLVGETKVELGGSHLLKILPPQADDSSSGIAPEVDPELAPRLFAAVHAAIASGCVRACHDLSEGGLAVAAAEMAFAGALGADVDLSAIPDGGVDLADAVALFSESNTRFLVEIPADRTATFERHLRGVPHMRIGAVSNGDRLVIRGSDGPLIDAPLADLKAAWQSPFAGF